MMKGKRRDGGTGRREEAGRSPEGDDGQQREAPDPN